HGAHRGDHGGDEVDVAVEQQRERYYRQGEQHQRHGGADDVADGEEDQALVGFEDDVDKAGARQNLPRAVPPCYHLDIRLPRNRLPSRSRCRRSPCWPSPSPWSCWPPRRG